MGERPRKPSLLVLASTYPRWRDDHEPGFVHELSRRLVDRFEVTVLTSSAAGALTNERMDGVRIVRYRYAPRALETLVYGGGIATHLRRSPWKWILVPGFVLGQWWVLKRLLKRLRPDAVHAHWLIPQGLLARAAYRQQRIPAYVVTSHGGDLYGFRGVFLQRLKRSVAADAAAMTVVSSAMCEAAEAQGLSCRALHVIPMGADLQHRFTPDAGVCRHLNRLLFVGRLVEKKGVGYLLQALVEVLKTHPDATLDIAGFGPLASDLQALARTLGVDHAVHFLGAVRQDALPTLYRSASLLVAPFVQAVSGDREGLPVVIMEAIGCGCPVIASDLPGVRDLLGDDDADCLVPPGDPQALAEAIRRHLHNPQALAPRAERRRQVALARVDWSVIAGRYADLLFHVVDSAHSAREH